MPKSAPGPRRVLLLSAVLSLFASQSRPEDTIVARYYDSGFAEAKGNYNGISTASDGRVYYVLSTESLDIGAQMFVFDPRSEKIEHVGDLTEASGEKSLKAVPQGKSHVRFFEYEGKLYFATHIGYYKREGSKELSLLAAISPDGRWLASSSDETGNFEVYVQPYPNPSRAKWRITFGGGRDPVWSRDVGELFYQNDTTTFAVAVTTEPTFSAAPPVALFDGAYVDSIGRWYDVAPDGRFLMVKPGWLSEGRETPVIHVVLNWFQELKRLAPTK